jgi:hypothetical protein
MEGLRFDYGARFLVGVPHPAASTESFAQGVLENRDVQRALGGARWRLLYVEPHEEKDKRTGRSYSRHFEAVLYDYSRNQTLRARGPAGGGGPLALTPTPEQPIPSQEEFDDAVALVGQSPVWGPLLQAGHVQPYRPMPPVLQPHANEAVERTLYIGLVSRPRRFNRIVAVNMVRREVSATEVRPRDSLATQQICGVDFVPCTRPRRGTAGRVTLQWPTDNPLWQFEVVRPSSSSGTNGSGIDLRNVFYRGRKVLDQAHLPLLNVQYDFNLCGPYRDWMYEETCFEAIGEDIPGAPGFRWCDQPPRTMFEKGTDGGNFVGVAVYERSDGSLSLLTQCAAGWYRYIMEWRFYQDGRLLPRFRFGGTNNSCVCNTHHHHAFWRLDFDVVETANVVEERIGTRWTSLRKETTRVRQSSGAPRWRVRHPGTGAGYELIPGPDDSVGDTFSGPDLYLMRYRSGELDDRRARIEQARADIAKFARGDNTYRADIVVWYVAHFRHAVREEEDEEHVEVGPTLRPFNWPG